MDTSALTQDCVGAMAQTEDPLSQAGDHGTLHLGRDGSIQRPRRRRLVIEDGIDQLRDLERST